MSRTRSFKMIARVRTGLLIILLAGTHAAFAQIGDGFAVNGAKECIACHDFGPDSPVHNLMAGSHGNTGDDTEEAGRRGCEDCHGPSANHANAPTQVSPGVSFGPRWTSTIAEQDAPCLACHEDNTARLWQHSLHMVNNVTCVTCHEIHAAEDKVLSEDGQAQVCTVCHKVQKQGIHGMEEMADFNPPCAMCHDPHHPGSPQTVLMNNGSEGCRSCHDLDSMARSSTVSDKAKRYHNVMNQSDRTCVDCHTGVAHAAADSTPASLPVPAFSRDITLFFPGMADSDWLLHSHPGSQPLRQGANCRQCHRGEEKAMGRAQAGDFAPASREMRVVLASDADSVRMTLRWKGERNEKDIALMWGTGTNEAFRRGGCFAACHADLPGMSKYRGQKIDKYLAVSREQQQSVGKPALVKSDAELKQLMAEGNFAVLWRVELASGKAEAATVLEDVDWQPGAPIRASTSYENGQWIVNIRRSLKRQPEHLVTFDPDNKYTFGIALHGANNPGGKHWVSLPLTFSYKGDDTDFKAK
jgi:DmsE family decaheme c-type cytochrome